jgi:hypothetical protein
MDRQQVILGQLVILDLRVAPDQLGHLATRDTLEQPDHWVEQGQRVLKDPLEHKDSPEALVQLVNRDCRATPVGREQQDPRVKLAIPD